MIRITRKKIIWTLAALPLLAFIVAAIILQFVDFSTDMESARIFFSNRNLEPSFHTYTTDHRDMHYVSVGEQDRPLIMFIHGSPGDWSAFITFMGDANLLKRARIISVDRPGFGHSGRGDFEASLAQQAADLKPILQENHNNGQKAILVGHSLGGPLIARMAMDYPNLIDALIFVAPSIDPELEKKQWFQEVASWRLINWVIPIDLLTSNREILPLKGELEAMLPMWRELDQDVTVIQGEKDRLVPAGNADFAAKMLVNADVEMVRIPDMDHFVPWTHPDLITTAISHHLDRLVESTSAVSSQ